MRRRRKAGIRSLARVWLTCLGTVGLAALESCAPAAREPLVYAGYLREPPRVRVALVVGAHEARMESNVPCEVTDLSSGGLLVRGPIPGGSTVRAGAEGVLVGERQLASSRVRVSAPGGGTIAIDGRPYRGDVLLLESLPGRITLVNELDMEEYLAGVIGSEMPLDWPTAALEAQAIAARTFAFYLVKTSPPEAEYHFQAGGQFSQEYAGLAGESPAARRIVADTRGVAMLYDWQVFPSFYHSVSGGHTRNVADVFGLRSIPPLMGVQDPFSKGSKYDDWQSSMPLSQLEERLRMGNAAVRAIQNVRSTRGPGGRYIVEIVHGGGKTELPAQEFRLLAGPDLVRSPEFAANIADNLVTFTGHGWGHGVGMCQWGAKRMAESRHDAIEILQYYYPGSDVVRIY